MDDQALDTATTSETDATAAASGEAASSPSPTDEHHDWATSFCGIDTRADSGSDAATGAVSTTGAGDLGNAVVGASTGALGATETDNSTADAAAQSAGADASASSMAATGSSGSLLGDAVGAVGGAVTAATDAVANVGSVALKSAEQGLGNVEAAVGNAGKALEAGASFGSVADGVVQSVADAGANVAHAAIGAAPLPDALKGAANTYVDFEKGVAEGVYSGAKGMVTGAIAATNMVDGVDLAQGVVGLGLSAAGIKEGDKMLADVKGDVTTNISAAEGMAKMATPIGQAESAAQVVQGFEQASAQGHGVEFVGKEFGNIGVNIAAGAFGGGEAGEPGEMPPGETPPAGGGGEPPGGSGGGEPPSSKGAAGEPQSGGGDGGRRDSGGPPGGEGGPTDDTPSGPGPSHNAAEAARHKAELASQHIEGADRVGKGSLNDPNAGSGLKDDPTHRVATFLSPEIAQNGKVSPIVGNDGVRRTLVQVPDQVVNGQTGIVEYVIDADGSITHQRFIEGGVIGTGPNQRLDPSI
jgi:hypothetical protein